jgi:LPS-assembly lipoprotein
MTFHRAFGLLCLAFLLPAALNGCGFTPVYGTGGGQGRSIEDGELTGAALALNQTAIAGIPNREGQVLRNHLIDRMYMRGRPAKPQRTLQITLTVSETFLGIRKDATASRTQLVVTAGYLLLDNKTGRQLTGGTIQSFVSFNILDLQFATMAARDAAKERALEEAGDKIINRLSQYYTSGK